MEAKSTWDWVKVSTLQASQVRFLSTCKILLDDVIIVNPKHLNLEVNKIKHVPEESLPTSLGHYLHWTQKETDEQPEAVVHALNYGARLAAVVQS